VAEFLKKQLLEYQKIEKKWKDNINIIIRKIICMDEKCVKLDQD